MATSSSKSELLKLLKNTLTRKQTELQHAHYQEASVTAALSQQKTQGAIERMMPRIVQSFITSGFNNSNIDEFCNALRTQFNAGYYHVGLLLSGLLKEDHEYAEHLAKIAKEEKQFQEKSKDMQDIAAKAERAIILNGLSDETRKLFEEMFNYVV